MHMCGHLRLWEGFLIHAPGRISLFLSECTCVDRQLTWLCLTCSCNWQPLHPLCWLMHTSDNAPRLTRECSEHLYACHQHPQAQPQFIRGCNQSRWWLICWDEARSRETWRAYNVG